MSTLQYQAKGAVQAARFRISHRRIKTRFAGLLRALTESASAAEHAAIFCHRADAQFAALPSRQQNALLDRGYRPR